MVKSKYEVLEEARVGVEEVMAKMLFLKKKRRRNREELRELITQAHVLFLNLRQINRVILQDEDHIKAETEATKTPFEHTTLELHNLLYEKNRYLKAIKACRDFKRKYPDIGLVSEEEFYKDAPDAFKEDSGPHKMMLQQLNFELYQRKELCKQQVLLEAHKKMLQESIANHKKLISSLGSQLKSLKKASLPVKQHLGILHTKRMKQHQLAELLPAPLYIVYSQFLSQKEAFDENIELDILGSAKDAQAVICQQATKYTGGSAENMKENKVDEGIREEDDSQHYRKRRKRSQLNESSNDEGIYETHPLSVILHVYDNEVGESGKQIKLLTVRFEYLPKLNIVCASTENFKETGIDMLTNLFPDDIGLDLPNQVAKLFAGVEFRYDNKRSLRPYIWVQHLAGIDFLPEAPPVSSRYLTAGDNSKNLPAITGLTTYREQQRVHIVLQKLRARRKAYLGLN